MIDESMVNAIADLKHPGNDVQDMYRKKVLVIGAEHYDYDDPNEPKPETLKVSTLTAVVDYMKANLADKPAIVQVVSPACVKIVAPLVGCQRNMLEYLVSAPLLPEMQFKTFVDPETFAIQLQSGFVGSPERDDLLRFCSKIRTGLAKEIVDDGVSQDVTVMATLTRTEDVKVKNPWNLQPFRTFPEIAQPTTAYLLRMRSSKSGDNINASIALYEADGGAWRAVAITSIGMYLRAALPDTIILA